MFEQFQKYEFPLYGWIRLPQVDIETSDKEAVGLKADATNVEFLRALARVGYAKHIKGKKSDETIYSERAKRELATVEKLGFVDYYLLVWKVCKWADKNGIARDYGRGSCAGSLIFWLIGVTLLDPIRYDLFFERFISEARAKKKEINGITYIDGGLAPDVDLDYEQKRRGEVIEFLKSIYPNRVCKISTVSTLSGKLLIKECGKIIGGYSEEEMKQISDLIPKVHGVVADIEDAYNGKVDEKTGEVKLEAVPAFKSWCDQNKIIYDTALSLRDLVKNKGTHPSGYVVSYDELSKFLPVSYTKSDDDTHEIASAFAMDDVSYQTIKLDLLGVRCCSVVSRVLKAIGKDIMDIDTEDPFIYGQLNELKTPHGIFQIEAFTNLRVCQKVKPRNLGELSDVLAIARPGALAYLDAYAKGDAPAPHAFIESILKTTRNQILYQEQVIQILAAIGFTKEEGEIARRVIGKKKLEEVAAWKEKITAKIRENNLDEGLVPVLLKLIEDNASYGFNKSHALAYASLSALTVYLKFKHPLEFFLALLQESQNEPNPIEEIQKIQKELHFFGIKLLPPDLLKSDMDFKIEGDNIRFGLGAIKGISDKTMNKLVNFKTDKSNRFELFQAAEDAELSVGIMCALILSGCLDSVRGNASRSSLVLQAQTWNILTGRERKKFFELGARYEYNIFKIYEKLREDNFIKESRHETFKKKYIPKKEIYETNSKQKELADYFYSMKFIGYSPTVNLYEVFSRNFDDLIRIGDVLEAEDNAGVHFVGRVSEKVITGKSKKGTQYAKWVIDDESGTIEVRVFNTNQNNTLDSIRAAHGGKLPCKDSVVYVYGTKKEGKTVFGRTVTDQCVKIYTKFADIKRDREEEEKAVDAAL